MSWHRSLALMLFVLICLPGEEASSCPEDQATTSDAPPSPLTAVCTYCGDVPNDALFTRLAMPRFVGIGQCYAVAKLPSMYVLLKLEEDPGYSRWESTNDGLTWRRNPEDLVFEGGGIVKNFKCIDLVETDMDSPIEPDTLHLYITRHFGTKVNHAISLDAGVSWTVDPDTVFITPPPPRWYGSVQNPSVIDINEYDPDYVQDYPSRRFIMAFAGGLGPNWKGIGVAYAPKWDGPFMADPTNSPVPPCSGQQVIELFPGQGRVLMNDPDIEWQQTGVFRPRLIVGPDNTLYMFYTGINYTMGVVRCQKFGYATSTDWGSTWKLGTGPGNCRNAIFECNGTGVGKDWGGVYCPDLVDMTPSGNPDLRLYYLGQGGTNGNLVSVLAADAQWSSLPALSLPGPRIPLGDLAQSRSPDEALVTGSLLTASPNPTTGIVSFLLAAQLRELAGSVSLAIFDTQGRRQVEVWSGEAAALPTSLDWEGIDDSAARLPSGRYVAALQRGSEILASTWISVTR